MAAEKVPAPPSIAELRRSTGRPDSFAYLREWIKAQGKLDKLSSVAEAIDAEHRHAIARFLWQESQAGVRAGRAKELIAVIEESPAFANIEKEQEWSTDLAEKFKNPSVAADVEPAPEAGLPSRGELVNPKCNDREIYQKLRDWTRRERSNGTLVEAGSRLGSLYRIAVFDFLCSFCGKKSVFKSQALQLLQRLAAIDTWCQGKACDLELLQTLVEETAGKKQEDEHRRRSISSSPSSMTPGQTSSSPSRRCSAPPPATRKCAGPPCRTGRMDSITESSTTAKTRACGAAVISGGPSEARSRNTLSAEGLPSVHELMDPRADGRELFQQLREWMRQERAGGTLEEAGYRFDPEYRRCIFAFLLAFAGKKTVLRSQARDMLSRLADIYSWCEGEVVSQEAVESVLNPEKDEKVAEAATDPRIVEKLLNLADGPSWSHRVPPLDKVLSSDEDPQEILCQLHAWVQHGRLSGRWASEASQLDAEHRRAITSFLCGSEGAGSRSPRSRRRRLVATPSTVSSQALDRAAGSPRMPAIKASVSPERYYVLQAILDLDTWFDEDDDPDRSAVSNVLAQIPRAL